MPTRRSTRISSRQNSNDLQNGFGRSGNRNLSYDLLPLSTSNTTTVTTITTITPPPPPPVLTPSCISSSPAAGPSAEGEPQLEDVPIEALGLLLKSVSDQLAFLERVSQLVGKNMDELSQTMMKINAEISKKEKVNSESHFFYQSAHMFN